VKRKASAMNETAKMAKDVLLRCKFGSLATVDFETGGPFASLVNYSGFGKGYPVFLLSRLARHTKSLLADARASLLVAEIPIEGDALEGLRATFVGHVEMIAPAAVQHAYLALHPYAETYVGFGDFSFYMLVPETIYVVGGFGRIQSFNADEVF
jgi:heme iron utilization protein